MEHDELCDLACKWIRATKTCFFVDKEIHAPTGQVPDALGINFGHSIMVECKTSRSDFFADRKKKNHGSTTGKYRFYLCPKGVIKPDDLEDGYGLLWANGKTVKDVMPIVGAEHYMKEGWGLDRRPKLHIRLDKSSLNPNLNEWCEYQIAIKIIRESNIRKLRQPCTIYDKKAFDTQAKRYELQISKLKETIDFLKGEKGAI